MREILHLLFPSLFVSYRLLKSLKGVDINGDDQLEDENDSNEVVDDEVNRWEPELKKNSEK